MSTRSHGSPADPGSPDLSPEALLVVEDLSTHFNVKEGRVNAVDGVSFEIKRGEVFGIVGESGSGKTVTGLSLIDLIDNPGRIEEGSIWFHHERFADYYRNRIPGAVEGNFIDLRQVPNEVWHSLRGESISMIFQDPMSGFNPTVTVGEQIAEAVEVYRRSTSETSGGNRTRTYSFGNLVLDSLNPSKQYISESSFSRAIELLEHVGIPDPRHRAEEYPHQFSGGMLQRAMIAQALAGKPDLLIADEPTTALDVTIQAQILNLLKRLQREEDMSVLLVTHNLGVIARMADKVGVMYAGQIAERGTPSDIFENHVHPYTEGLFGSVPDMDSADRLNPIPGNVPSLLNHEMGNRCYFVDRCPKAMEKCLNQPPDFEVGEGHKVKCYLAEESYDSDSAL